MDKVLNALKDLLSGSINQEPWECDVMSSLSELIEAHNDYALKIGDEVEQKFKGTTYRKRNLSEVLKEDYIFLMQSCPGYGLEILQPHIRFFEELSPEPNAHAISLSIDNEPAIAVIFRTPLLYFIHSFYSKIFMLCFQNRNGDCLPIHDQIMAGEEYSDWALFAGIFNDLEVFYNQKLLFTEIKPKHLATPYTYCEWVEFTRRFILAHELGHFEKASQDGVGRTKEPLLKVKEFTQEVYGRELPDKTIKAWETEIFCDLYGLLMLTNRFENTELEGTPLYELESTLIGIILFFTMLDFVEIIQGTRNASHPIGIEDSTHPPAIVRREIIRYVIKNLPMYTQSSNLRNTINNSWRSFQVIQNYLSSAGGRYDLNWSLYKHLTPVGKEMMLKFNSIVTEQTRVKDF